MNHQLRLIACDPVPTKRGWADPVPTPCDDLPDVREFGQRVAQAVIDVLAGHRPVTQLLRWARPDVFEALRARIAITTTPRTASARAVVAVRRPVVRSVRACPITATAVEFSAVVVEGDRVRALAMRLEGLDGRWRISALVIG